jgi:hypothetical protein
MIEKGFRKESSGGVVRYLGIGLRAPDEMGEP